MTTPREIDTAIAEQYHALAAAEQQLAYSRSHLYSLAGAQYYYRGRRRVTDMTLDEAVATVTTQAAYVAEYKAANGYVEDDGYHGTNWDTFRCPGRVATYQADEPAEQLAKLAERQAAAAAINAEIDRLEESYTGWSRFFLVTSSPGHIHSSMHCSSCRPTTTYGWLPQLSGKTEDAAVAEHGPTLCSVCFPSAPVEWTSGKKLTAAQAAKAAH